MQNSIQKSAFLMIWSVSMVCSSYGSSELLLLQDQLNGLLQERVGEARSSGIHSSASLPKPELRDQNDKIKNMIYENASHYEDKKYAHKIIEQLKIFCDMYSIDNDKDWKNKFDSILQLLENKISESIKLLDHIFNFSDCVTAQAVAQAMVGNGEEIVTSIDSYLSSMMSADNLKNMKKFLERAKNSIEASRKEFEKLLNGKREKIITTWLSEYKKINKVNHLEQHSIKNFIKCLGYKETMTLQEFEKVIPTSHFIDLKTDFLSCVKRVISDIPDRPQYWTKEFERQALDISGLKATFTKWYDNTLNIWLRFDFEPGRFMDFGVRYLEEEESIKREISSKISTVQKIWLDDYLNKYIEKLKDRIPKGKHLGTQLIVSLREVFVALSDTFEKDLSPYNAFNKSDFSRFYVDRILASIRQMVFDNWLEDKEKIKDFNEWDNIARLGKQHYSREGLSSLLGYVSWDEFSRDEETKGIFNWASKEIDNLARDLLSQEAIEVQDDKSDIVKWWKIGSPLKTGNDLFSSTIEHYINDIAQKYDSISSKKADKDTLEWFIGRLIRPFKALIKQWMSTMEQGSINSGLITGHINELEEKIRSFNYFEDKQKDDLLEFVLKTKERIFGKNYFIVIEPSEKVCTEEKLKDAAGLLPCVQALLKECGDELAQITDADTALSQSKELSESCVKRLTKFTEIALRYHLENDLLEYVKKEEFSQGIDLVVKTHVSQYVKEGDSLNEKRYRGFSFKFHSDRGQDLNNVMLVIDELIFKDLR